MRLRDALKRIARIGERTRQDAEGDLANTGMCEPSRLVK